MAEDRAKCCGNCKWFGHALKDEWGWCGALNRWAEPRDFHDCFEQDDEDGDEEEADNDC